MIKLLWKTVFNTDKYVLSKWFSTAPRNPPKSNGKICPQKEVFVNVHRSIFHNSPKVEAIYLLFNQWMGKQMWYIHMMGCYSAMKGNKVLIHMWNKTLMLSERARHIRLYIVWFHLYEMLEKDKTVEIESRSLAAEDWKWEWEMIASRPKGCLEVVVFQNWIAVIFARLCAFTKTNKM